MGAPNVQTPATGRISAQADAEILQLAHQFDAIDRQLDTVAQEEHAGESAGFMSLHQQWLESCSRVAALPALTSEGRQAKARMLHSVLSVVCPNPAEYQIHELLTASLVRDVLA